MAPEARGLALGRPQSGKNLVERLGALVLQTIESTGRDTLLLARSVLWFRSIPSKRHEILRQMFICGVMSFPVVLVVSIFTGGVYALQAGLLLRNWGLEAQIGAIVSASLVREMGPIMTALILAGRVGSAMAAELGTMRVSEEIDALEAMSIDPVRFLVMPRLVAVLIMAPVLTVLADFIGVMGGALVAFHQVGVSYASYYHSAREALCLTDLNSSLVKALVFGMLIAITGCGQGLRAKTSAEGVGQATKDAVVVSFILIIIFNYLVTSVARYFY